ncbi:MAG: twin-arginine translocation signal domain-containing protein [Bacteroidota bacterium]|nr:twin-arginine translocation signal domain-containing protein [Bacteroidota bacterium]
MPDQINRRKFIVRSSLLGAAAILSGPLIPKSLEASGLFGKADITIYHGKDHYHGTMRAVGKLGGFRKFIKKDKRSDCW